MFSLDNAYSAEEMAEFHRRVVEGLSSSDVPHFAVEPKLDGASVEVIYENGVLAQATTRGDGTFSADLAIPAKVGLDVYDVLLSSDEDAFYNAALSE